MSHKGCLAELQLDLAIVLLAVRNDVANISRIVYSTSEVNPNRAFGINALSIVQPVLEPLTIFGTIIGGTSAWKMKRKLKAIAKKV
jgi:hypothetical protein